MAKYLVPAVLFTLCSFAFADTPAPKLSQTLELALARFGRADVDLQGRRVVTAEVTFLAQRGLLDLPGKSGLTFDGGSGIEQMAVRIKVERRESPALAGFGGQVSSDQYRLEITAYYNLYPNFSPAGAFRFDDLQFGLRTQITLGELADLERDGAGGTGWKASRRGLRVLTENGALECEMSSSSAPVTFLTTVNKEKTQRSFRFDRWAILDHKGIELR